MKKILEKMEEMVEVVEDHARLPIEPLVSVFMTTYNHERFIAQALDGILMQDVDFPYEIVIGEDKSTDRTREIVCEYQRNHPDKIRLRLAKENLYSRHVRHSLTGFPACRGKYIAICEGDDYWTDPKKLQKQVAVLEAEPDISACFTNAAIVHESGAEQPSAFLGEGPPRTLAVKRRNAYVHQKDLIEALLIPTCTQCFRADYVRNLPDWVAQVPTGDWGLAIILAQHGPLKYLDETTAVYRRHAGGVWAPLSDLDMLAAVRRRLDVFLPYADAEHKPLVGRALTQKRDELRRHAVGYLTMKLKKDGARADREQRKVLSKYFARNESRQICILAWERYFQQAYFQRKTKEARRRGVGLVARYPEWLLQKGSVGQLIRAVLGI